MPSALQWGQNITPWKHRQGAWSQRSMAFVTRDPKHSDLRGQSLYYTLWFCGSPIQTHIQTPRHPIAQFCSSQCQWRSLMGIHLLCGWRWRVHDSPVTRLALWQSQMEVWVQPSLSNEAPPSASLHRGVGSPASHRAAWDSKSKGSSK